MLGQGLVTGVTGKAEPTTIGEAAKPNERIGMARVMQQVKDDLPTNVATAGVDTAIGVGTGQITSVKGAIGNTGGNVAGTVQQTGMAMSENSIERSHAERVVESEIVAHPDAFAKG